VTTDPRLISRGHWDHHYLRYAIILTLGIVCQYQSLSTKRHQFYLMPQLAAHRTANTLRLSYTIQSANSVQGKIAVCSQIHTKHINAAVWEGRGIFWRVRRIAESD